MTAMSSPSEPAEDSFDGWSRSDLIDKIAGLQADLEHVQSAAEKLTLERDELLSDWEELVAQQDKIVDLCGNTFADSLAIRTIIMRS